MKKARVLITISLISLGALISLCILISSQSTSILAAPKLGDNSPSLPQENFSASYLFAFNCTLATTTTDSLNEDNSTSDLAVPLSSYNNLALAPGDKDESVPAEEDWFRLDNAQIGGTYEIEAVPDKTTNYNLGIVVYNSAMITIDSDIDYTSNNFAQVTLEPTTYGPYYFKIYQLTPGCTGQTYDLSISVASPTSTPSPNEDDYEDNNIFDDAYALPIATSASATNASFFSDEITDDVDWFKFYVKSGRYYRASTSNLSGVDTFIEVFDRGNNLIGSDNDSGGGFASKFEWQASYEGYYYVRVTNRVTSGSEDTYDLTVAEIGTPPTNTPAPGATAVSGVDSCENNFEFDSACVIAADKTYTFNFLSPYGSGPDNDFFKIWVKPGLLFDCATSDLAPGVDPNMIVYDNNRNAIGGNDDVEPGNYNSAFSYYATYEGWLYLLVGTGDRTPSDPQNSSYSLECESRVPGEATATRSPAATNTPRPGETATPTKAPTPAPTSQALTVRKLTTPTPAPATTPAPRFIPIDLLVYYDENNDRQPGAGEGIGGISAQAYEAATNQSLAQGFTDEQGHLEFSVSAQGPVRVSVPFFGFTQLVAGAEGASIYLRVPPRAQGTP